MGGEVVPVVPTVRALKWRALEPRLRVDVVRVFAQRRGLEAPAALELMAEALRVEEHWAGADVDAAIEASFDAGVRAPLAETFRRLGETMAPLLQHLSAAAEAFLESARAAGIDLEALAAEGPQASCVCLCGQHWDRPGVCEGFVPEVEAVVFELPANKALITVCAPCADARQAGPGGRVVRVGVS